MLSFELASHYCSYHLLEELHYYWMEVTQVELREVLHKLKLVVRKGGHSFVSGIELEGLRNWVLVLNLEGNHNLVTRTGLVVPHNL